MAIAALNILKLPDEQHLHQFIATVLLVLTIYPMWRYLRRSEERLPLVPLFSIIYGLHYGLAIFLPFDRYPTYLLAISTSGTD